MAHVAKYTRGSVGTLSRHYERAKDKDGNYIKFGNQDIDPARTHLNYNLAPDHNQLDFVKQRCSEVQCMNRVNVKIMCSWIVTAPKDLPASDHQTFFQESYDFLHKRYGGEKNVISAFVHMDESTPHMHFAFIPVVTDRKKQIEKVAAKECLTRRDLQTFHPELDARMAQVFGRNIGVLNEATRDGNLTVIELKTKTANDQLQKTSQDVSNASRTLQNTLQRIKDSKAELKRVEGLITSFRGTLNTVSDIESIGTKTPMGILIKPQDAQRLKNQAKAYFGEQSRALRAISEKTALVEEANKVKPLQDEVQKLEKSLKHTENLLKSKEKNLEAIKGVIRGNPDLRQAYNAEVNRLNEEKEAYERREREEMEKREWKHSKSRDDYEYDL